MYVRDCRNQSLKGPTPPLLGPDTFEHLKSQPVWFLRTNNSLKAKYSLENSIFLHKMHINPNLDASRKYFPQKSSPEAKYFQNWCLFINKC